jgi:hypothetical protein
VQFKKILAPIDFSPASRNGLKYALRFAEEFGAELTLLYVLEPPASASFVAIPGAVAFSQAYLAEAEKDLRSLVASVRHQSNEPRWRVRASVPSHTITLSAANCSSEERRNGETSPARPEQDAPAVAGSRPGDCRNRWDLGPVVEGVQPPPVLPEPR